MKKKIITGVLIAVVVLLSCAVSYSIAYYRYHLVEVPVLKRELKKREIISSKDIAYLKMPYSMVLENIYLNENEIIGLVSNTSLPAGSFFFKESVVSRDNISDRLIYELQENEVTYDLFTREISVNSAYLKKDMMIDIYATLRGQKVISDLLVNNARILSLYNVSYSEIEDGNEAVAVITVAVDKDCVSYLNKALIEGTLRVVLSGGCYEEGGSRLNKESELFSMLNE